MLCLESRPLERQKGPCGKKGLHGARAPILANL